MDPNNTTNDSDLTVTTIGSLSMPMPATSIGHTALAKPVPISGQQVVHAMLKQQQQQQQRIDTRQPVQPTLQHSSVNAPATATAIAVPPPSGGGGGGGDPFPDEMSCVEQDESRSSSPRSLMSGASACWTHVRLTAYRLADCVLVLLSL
jgi:hypothetical protein